MTDFQISDESNDFEVLPREGAGGAGFMSINSATSGDGDPYEKRSDIVISKTVVEELKKKLNFESEEKIDELREKLKSRDGLDAGIGDEVNNLDELSKSTKSEELAKAAEAAKEFVATVRRLASEKKTTVKRALDILEITLPVFLLACELSQDDAKLSEEYAILQEEYEETKKEMDKSQTEFDMEKRAEHLRRGKNLLLRTVSAANEDLQRVSDKLSEEIESKHVEQFSQAQNDVELVIGTERDELDAWLLSCNGDCKNIEVTIDEQLKRHDESTKDFTARLKSIDVSLGVNKEQQMELIKKLDELKEEEKKLQKTRVFENQVQERANQIHSEVLEELEYLREKINDIHDNASTAQEIMMNMQLCSELLFGKAFETQRVKEENLRQLKLEALIRERNALSSAVVEFKLQVRMSEANVTEYEEQLESVRKEIERAAKRGQSITVSKKKADLKDYEEEIEKEKEVIKENKEKCQELEERLAKVDAELDMMGVLGPSVDSLLDQRIAVMRLESSGPASLVSM